MNIDGPTDHSHDIHGHHEYGESVAHRLRIRSRIFGYALVTIGLLAQPLIIATAIGTFVFLVPSSHHNPYLFSLYFFVGFSLVPVLAGPLLRRCRRLVTYGRRHLTPAISSIQQLNNEPFVLYLRPFDDDAARQEMDWIRDPQDLPLGTLFTNFAMSIRTHEEQIIAALKPIGRVVTVSRPGEQLPYMGAQRLHLPPEASWQDTIIDLIPKAHLVILAAGLSPGLLWEFFHTVQNVSPKRFVLLVVMDFESYTQFRHVVAKEIPAASKAPSEGNQQVRPWPRLPDRLPEHGNALDKGWVILFDEDWTPNAATINLPKPGFVLARKQTEASVRRALRPLIRALMPPGYYDHELHTALIVGAMAGGLGIFIARFIITNILHINLMAIPAVLLGAISIIVSAAAVLVGATLNVYRVMRRYGKA